MTHNKENKECEWNKAECSWKETHEYCPHEEHMCTCKPPKTDGMEEIKKNIHLLRQWLNEDRIDDPKKFVTNEQIEKWLLTKKTMTPLQNKREEQMKGFDEKFPKPELKRIECEGVGDNNGFYEFTPKTVSAEERIKKSDIDLTPKE